MHTNLLDEKLPYIKQLIKDWLPYCHMNLKTRSTICAQAPWFTR